MEDVQRVARAGKTKAPFQFGLRDLLVLTAVVAVACSLLFASPPWVGLLAAVCFVVAYPAVLAVLLIQTRGYARTLWIGAVFPAMLAFLALSMDAGFVLLASLRSPAVELSVDLDDLGRWPGAVAVAIWLLSMAVGLLAVGVRWIVDRAQREP